MNWSNFKSRWRLRRQSEPAANERPMSDEALPPAAHILTGQRGEKLAAAYLERAGYHLVARNVTLPVGRNHQGRLIHAELDIVAYERQTLCFVEVKTRFSDWFAAPEANVDLRKQRQIARAARAYRRTFGLLNASYRYDVVTVVLQPEKNHKEQKGNAAATPAPAVKLLRGFWTDAKFRKRRWADVTADY